MKPKFYKQRWFSSFKSNWLSLHTPPVPLQISIILWSVCMHSRYRTYQGFQIPQLRSCLKFFRPVQAAQLLLALISYGCWVITILGHCKGLDVPMETISKNAGQSEENEAMNTKVNPLALFEKCHGLFYVPKGIRGLHVPTE